MTPSACIPRPPGLLLAELQVGRVYLDRLSGFHVLVQVDRHNGPHEGNPRRVTTSTTKYGWYWNPVFATHMRMELRDHQLMPLGNS